MPRKYLATLMQIFKNSEGNIRPAEAWQQFQAINGDNNNNRPTDLPDPFLQLTYF